MRIEAKEPELMDNFEDALATAAKMRRAVIVVPFGQGYDTEGNW
jgi:hypothetical protein